MPLCSLCIHALRVALYSDAIYPMDFRFISNYLVRVWFISQGFTSLT